MSQETKRGGPEDRGLEEASRREIPARSGSAPGNHLGGGLSETWRGANPLALFTTLSAAATLMGLALFSGLPVNPDSGLYLLAASEILRGSVPFVGHIDLNPPMVQYIHVIPVYVAWVLHTDPGILFHLFVTAIALYSGWAVYHGLSLCASDMTPSGALFVTAAWLVFAMLPMTLGGYGQREHLFILAFAGWLLCRETRHRGLDPGFGFALAAGLIAGPFMLLKPHFLLVTLGLECWMLFRTRRWSALRSVEPAAVMAWAVAYGVHFLFVPPEMTSEFLFRWVPFVAANYGVYNCSWSGLLLSGLLPYGFIPFSLLAAGLLGLAAGRWVRPGLRLRTGTLSLGVFLCMAVYLAQHKGWPYQLFPAAGLATLLIAGLWVELIERGCTGSPKWSRISPYMFAASCILIVALLWPIFLRVCKVAEHQRILMEPYLKIIRKYSSPHDTVALMDTTPMTGYPALLYSRRRPGLRYLVTFPIPMLYKGYKPAGPEGSVYREAADRTHAERRFLQELAVDVEERRPKLVFVQARRTCWGCPKGFRIEEYLRAAGWWPKVMDGYEFLTRVGIFDVYRRKSQR